MLWDNKNVLVTGGAGVIGQSLIAQLVAAKANVTCIDRAARPADMDRQVRYLQRDISEMNADEIAGTNPGYIFHLAATFERSEETPEFCDENYRHNIIVSHTMTDAARRCKGLEKFIFASSYLIYAPRQYMFDAPRRSAMLLKETDMIDPRNLCGAAKFFTEKELEYMHNINAGFVGISARIYRVYGLGSRDVISRWARMALRGEELSVYQKENMFDYIYAGDVAEGLIRMAAKVDSNEIINLGTGNPRKIDEVIKVFRKLVPGVKITESSGGALYEASGADVTKLRKMTGWQPPTTIEEGIARVVEYEKRRMA